MTITSVQHPPGRLWGVAALIAVAVPLPFLLALNVLSAVIRSQVIVPGSPPAEMWFYAIFAIGGLIFFPVAFGLGLLFAITAVRRPRRSGRVMGWIAIAVVVLAIPALWFGYLVWIAGS